MAPGNNPKVCQDCNGALIIKNKLRHQNPLTCIRHLRDEIILLKGKINDLNQIEENRESSVKRWEIEEMIDKAIEYKKFHGFI